MSPKLSKGPTSGDAFIRHSSHIVRLRFEVERAVSNRAATLHRRTGSELKIQEVNAKPIDRLGKANKSSCVVDQTSRLKAKRTLTFVEPITDRKWIVPSERSNRQVRQAPESRHKKCSATNLESTVFLCLFDSYIVSLVSSSVNGKSVVRTFVRLIDPTLMDRQFPSN
jgi:hypothetical protein